MESLIHYKYNTKIKWLNNTKFNKYNLFKNFSCIKKMYLFQNIAGSARWCYSAGATVYS